MGSRNLGDTAVSLNRLIGYGPVLLGGSQVNGIDSNGQFTTGGSRSMGDYMVHMIRVQALLADRFKLKAKQNDVTGQMAAITKSLGESKSAEND